MAGDIHSVLEPVGAVENILAERLVTAARLAFIRDGIGAIACARLSQYEAARERLLCRAMHELQRLPVTTAGQLVLLPVAVDIMSDDSVAKLPKLSN